MKLLFLLMLSMSRIINKYHYPSLLLNMKFEIEIYIDEDDETIVLQNVSSLTNKAKEEGFKIGEIELKGSKHKENEDNYYKHKHHNEDNR